ncbi:MAG: EAL domain-containing protein, partial [Rubrivivax sp.]|nr:EAL domain-containing protein [Rubrivivax sp.]
MSVVAEGVENEAQAALLRRYGCDALQGFLAAPPMPADAVPGFLAAWAAEPGLPAALGDAPALSTDTSG